MHNPGEMRATVDKRERLVSAAMQLFYQQGFARTSLADVAAHSEVPIGNVYYYFKTKESLAEAVIAAYRAKVETWHQQAEEGATPRERLKRWLDHYAELCLDLLDWGCPFGRLLLDFKQQSESLGAQAAELYISMIEWVRQQFAQYPGEADLAEVRAQVLISRAQGISVISLILCERQAVLNHFQALAAYIENPN